MDPLTTSLSFLGAASTLLSVAAPTRHIEYGVLDGRMGRKTIYMMKEYMIEGWMGIEMQESSYSAVFSIVSLWLSTL